MNKQFYCTSINTETILNIVTKTGFNELQQALTIIGLCAEATHVDMLGNQVMVDINPLSKFLEDKLNKIKLAATQQNYGMIQKLIEYAESKFMIYKDTLDNVSIINTAQMAMSYYCSGMMLYRDLVLTAANLTGV